MSGPVVTPDPNFWGLVDIGGDNECWPWKGGSFAPKPTAISGYGYYYSEAGRVPAHRQAYILTNGKIGPEFVVDHLCRNPCCVNPAHLEAVSNVENVMRGMSPPAQNARKAKCKDGHLLVDENVYLYRGKRHCLACKKARFEDERRQPDFKERRRINDANYRARRKVRYQQGDAA